MTENWGAPLQTKNENSKYGRAVPPKCPCEGGASILLSQLPEDPVSWLCGLITPVSVSVTYGHLSL